MFFQDETDEQYPVDGTLEEKAAHGLEQVRSNFFQMLRSYSDNKVGGPRHTNNVIVYGQAWADADATRHEAGFRGFLKNAFLTEAGETTDPRYPIDKMINRELRRQRAVIIQSIGQFTTRVRDMLPDDVANWTEAILQYTMGPYINKYNNSIYDQLLYAIPGRDLKPRPIADLVGFLNQMAFKYSNPNVTSGVNKDFLVDRLRDEVIEYLLQDIPYNNKALEQKKELIADEKAKPKQEKPVLH